MIDAPAPRLGLVRRCAIAALGTNCGAPLAPRTVRSPLFARRIDDALANADDHVPASVRDAIAARLVELGLRLPSEPATQIVVDAAALRAVLDGLLAAEKRTNERIASAFRAQGATAHEVVATIALELGLDGDAVAPMLAVAEALDEACTLLERTWEPGDLRLALRRELEPQPAANAPQPAAPQIVDAEPSRPLPGRRKHFSASSLNLYADCPRKWYFKYLCGAVEDKPTSASSYGPALHV
ncbi:MAG: PD-(D/E)XK nuclease family protein, partial [Candidatus Eremiobacteraeota bacterium]|nr:PD-(D/E)XK nuclease family protein [Candidatus Eremiobacteraeota bacterium]